MGSWTRPAATVAIERRMKLPMMVMRKPSRAPSRPNRGPRNNRALLNETMAAPGVWLAPWLTIAMGPKVNRTDHQQERPNGMTQPSLSLGCLMKCGIDDPRATTAGQVLTGVRAPH